jgi:hypothetical protein
LFSSYQIGEDINAFGVNNYVAKFLPKEVYKGRGNASSIRLDNTVFIFDTADNPGDPSLMSSNELM